MKRPLELLIPLLLLSGVALAQNPDYELIIDNAIGAPGQQVLVGVGIENNGDPIQAWSFSVCHDPLEVTPVDANIGLGALAVNGGQGPDFFFAEAVPEGIHCIAIVSLIGGNTLPVGFSDLLEMTYFLGPAPLISELEFCDTVGDPPTVTILVVDEQGEVPTQFGGEIEISGVPIPPSFTFTIPDANGFFDPDTGIGSVEVFPAIEQTGGSTQSTTGFSMAWQSDPVVLEPASVDPFGLVANLNGGAGPDFFAVNLLADAITIDVTYSTTGDTIVFIGASSVAQVFYDTNETTLQGVMGGLTTDLTWANGLGLPPIDNLVVVDPMTFAPDDLVDGTVALNLQDLSLRIPDTSSPSGALVDTEILLDNLIEVAGWSWGVCHDSTLVDVTDVQQGSTLLTVNNGGPPDFYVTDFFPGEGWTVGCVVNFLAAASLGAGADHQMNTMTYDVFGPDGSQAVLQFCATLGAPMIDIVIVDTSGSALTPVTSSGIIEIGTITPTDDFLRGDIDGDGTFNGLLDGLYVLNFQFIPGSPAPPCLDAADVDDDGALNGLVDGLFTLNFQFIAGSPPPPPPGAFSCGPDPTQDAIDCETPPSMCP